MNADEFAARIAAALLNKNQGEYEELLYLLADSNMDSSYIFHKAALLLEQ